ncbi:hypothetical protein Ga0100231_005315 [Opitutaceae bacterium TAV4]|nr:hypothetical protein Ga0100231_005315 [Opitutaceae bacterium TAV4]
MNGVPLQLHEAILGQTGSGKSHLAKHKASHLKASGIGVLVLHMDIEPWPLACHSWQTDDPAEFLRMFWAARNCACFMELADAEVDKYDLGFHRCFTKGRHFGHRCFFVSQRAAQVHPAIREKLHIPCAVFCSSGPGEVVVKRVQRSRVAQGSEPATSLFLLQNEPLHPGAAPKIERMKTPACDIAGVTVPGFVTVWSVTDAVTIRSVTELESVTAGESRR